MFENLDFELGAEDIQKFLADLRYVPGEGGAFFLSIRAPSGVILYPLAKFLRSRDAIATKHQRKAHFTDHSRDSFARATGLKPIRQSLGASKSNTLITLLEESRCSQDDYSYPVLLLRQGTSRREIQSWSYN